MRKIIVLLFILFATARLYAQNRTLDSLKMALNRAKTDTGREKLLNDLGGRFGMGQTKNDSALWYSQQALNLSQKIKDINGELNARLNMSRYFMQTGNYPEALKLSLYNLTMARKFHQMKILFPQTRRMGWIYASMGDYRKELEYEKQLAPLANSFKWGLPGYPMAVANQCISMAYSDLNMPDSALSYSRLVYQFGVKNNDPVWLMLGAGGMGTIYARKGNLDSAFLYYKISLQNAIKRNRLDLVSRAENNIARLFYQQGETDSAFFYVRKSQKELQLTNDPSDLINADSLLATLFQNSYQYDSAYIYLKEYVVLNDSLNNQNKIAQALNFSFNETIQQQQITQAKKEARQRYETRIKFYSLSALLLIILIVAFLLFRNNRNRRKANALLQQKNIEIETQRNHLESTLSELKSTQRQLIQSEKMASLGELTAGIAHEIQNPLNFVNNFSEVNRELIGELKAERLKPGAERNDQQEDDLLRDIDANEEKILHHGKRADAIVKGMLQHSRGSSGEKKPTDINALADEYLRLSYHGMRAKDKSFNATMKTDFDQTIDEVIIVPQDIGRVLLNLYNNAFYAASLPPEGETKDPNDRHVPTVWVSTKKEGSEIMIRVRDNGPGISDAIKDKIFQPFFTTKPTGEGTGLGLSLSYDIIKAHDGEIKIRTKEGEGTEFTMILPDNSFPSGRIKN